MNKYLVAKDFSEIIARARREPAMMMWNRLESHPVANDFSRSLKAEVRDPLWLITRQWQMGEFEGEDAGSPVQAKVAWTLDPITAISDRDGITLTYSNELPIEALTETRPVDFAANRRDHLGDWRLILGRRWEKLLRRAGLQASIPDFVSGYPYIVADPEVEGDFPITAAAAAWQTMSAARHTIDGGALYHHIDSGGAASDDIGILPADKATVDALGEDFASWARRQILRPADGFDSWDSRHLEYNVRLNTSVGDQPAALGTPEYHGGRMDWYHFDAVPAPEGTTGPATPAKPKVTSFIPVPAQFDGMPNTRHWAFEESITNFGEIKPDTTDLAKLLLIDFGLLSANDWFVVPIELPVGTLTQIEGLVVTNNFGERQWIEPAVTRNGPIAGWQMYRLAAKGRVDERLFLPPVAPLGLESVPIEAVDFVRDEVANMVWGLERIVPLIDGSSRPGREVAIELHARYQSAVVLPGPVPSGQPALVNEARVQYRLMRSVDEHWIPFVPAHVAGSNHEVQLQRAAMPRILEGTAGMLPQKVRPRTTFLREGLDQPTPVAYFLAEEEVERAGTNVEARWQRCRWQNGAVVLWRGNRRSVGRGEATSGLAFDFLERITARP